MSNKRNNHVNVEPNNAIVDDDLRDFETLHPSRDVVTGMMMASPRDVSEKCRGAFVLLWVCRVSAIVVEKVSGKKCVNASM